MKVADPTLRAKADEVDRLAARALRNAEDRTGPDADWWNRTATWLMGHAATLRSESNRYHYDGSDLP